MSSRPLSFGISIVPNAEDLALDVDLVKRADSLGLDLVGVQDHPYQRRYLDTFALLGHLLAQTERIGFFPDVANLPLRPPAVLAKHAASLDLLSGGRFELGLGAGGFWDAIEAMGGPRRTPGESVDALSEAIDVIRLAWSDERAVSYDGDHYRLKGYRPGPRPAHDIGIWLGVIGPRALRLTGELGDGWVPSMAYAPPSQAAKSHDIIDEAARAAGRDPAAIRRIYNIGGDVAPVIEAGLSDDDQQIVGPRDHWVSVLTHLAVDLGFSTFVLWGVPTAPRLRMFIEEIAPAVKARVAEAREARGITAFR